MKKLSKALAILAVSGGMVLTGSSAANAWYWDPEFSADVNGNLNQIKYQYFGVSYEDSIIKSQPGDYWGFGRGKWVPEEGDDPTDPPPIGAALYGSNCPASFETSADGMPIISTVRPVDYDDPEFTGNIILSQGNVMVNGVYTENFKTAQINKDYGVVIPLPQMTWKWMDELRQHVMTSHRDAARRYCRFEYSVTFRKGSDGMIPRSVTEMPLSKDGWMIGQTATGLDDYSFRYNPTEYACQVDGGTWIDETCRKMCPYTGEWTQVDKWDTLCAKPVQTPEPPAVPTTSPSPTPTATKSPGPNTPSTTVVKPAKRAFTGRYKTVKIKRVYVQKDGKWSMSDIRSAQKKVRALAKAKWERKQK